MTPKNIRFIENTVKEMFIERCDPEMKISYLDKENFCNHVEKVIGEKFSNHKKNVEGVKKVGKKFAQTLCLRVFEGTSNFPKESDFKATKKSMEDLKEDFEVWKEMGGRFLETAFWKK